MLVLFVVMLVALLGFAALAIDVASWFHAHDQAQTTADAAALAGAQELPGSATATEADAKIRGIEFTG